MSSALPTAGDVRAISAARREPDWMLRSRLHGLESLHRHGDGLGDFVGESVLRVADPRQTPLSPSEREAKGVAASIAKMVEGQGVRFLDTDTALRDHPDLVREHWGTILPPNESPMAAANAALWSGGSFLYVPAGVKVAFPLQADMLEDGRKVGPFERTLVVAESDAEVEFVDGCTSPLYPSQSRTTAVVEVVARPGARVRYIEFQNWSSDVANVVLKRAHVDRGASMEWLDANIGSRETRNVPEVRLVGPGATAEVLSVSLASEGRTIEMGAYVAHLAPETHSRIACRSVVRGAGRATHRVGLLVAPGARASTAALAWSTLLLDDASRFETFPSVEIHEAAASVSQEGSAQRLDEDAIFYLMSRGFSRPEAVNAIVMGLLDPFLKRIPMEYAVEFDRLIELELEDAVG